MNQITIKHTFAKYVSLNILGMIGLSCYILADTFFVARGLGASGLTALNLAIPIYSIIHGTGLMIGMGGATRFAISKSSHAFGQSLYYAAFASCLFLIIGSFFSNQLSSLLGADVNTLQNTSIYLRTILCFAPMFLLNNVIICFVRNDGNPKLSMMAMLIGSISNIVLDYIFIFPCNMGMFGAAFATGIAPIISIMVLSSHFLKGHNSFTVSAQKPQFGALRDITALGIAALVTEFSSGIVIIVFNSVILRLEGNIGVAAYGIIANIALVAISVFTGISQGIQPIISFFHGVENNAAIRKVLRYACITAVSIAVFIYIIAIILAEPIVGLFNKDANLQLAKIAANGLRIYFTAFAFAGINIICATYFCSVDNPKNAFILSFLRGFVIIIPSALILPTVFGINGAWLAMPFTEALVLLISAIMFIRVKR